MPTETPMGKGAHLILDLDADQDAGTIILNDGNGNESEIAWKAPDASLDSFRWLAKSAASFHKIPLEVVE